MWIDRVICRQCDRFEEMNSSHFEIMYCYRSLVVSTSWSSDQIQGLISFHPRWRYYRRHPLHRRILLLDHRHPYVQSFPCVRLGRRHREWRRSIKFPSCSRDMALCKAGSNPVPQGGKRDKSDEKGRRILHWGRERYRDGFQEDCLDIYHNNVWNSTLMWEEETEISLNAERGRVLHVSLWP